MNAALIMEVVSRTVTIHMEATTVFVIVDTYYPPIKRIVMVRRLLCFILIVIFIFKCLALQLTCSMNHPLSFISFVKFYRRST